MSFRVRHACWLIFAAALALLPGCPAPAPCTPSAIRFTPAPAVDYTRTADLALLTQLLTNLRHNPAAADQIRQQFGDAATLTFRTVGSIRATYLLMRTPEATTIAIGGTDDLKDIKFDLQTALVLDDKLGIMVDRGFRDMARDLYDDVRPLLSADETIDVTGYSLGGAAAVILSLYLRNDGLNVSAVATFGQPQFTDTAGAAEIGDLPLVRFVAGDDPIPRLPQADHAHIGPEVRLLDGAYIAFVPADQAGCLGTIDLDYFQAHRDDHASYVKRTSAKIGVTVVQVPYEDGDSYLEE